MSVEMTDSGEWIFARCQGKLSKFRGCNFDFTEESS